MISYADAENNKLKRKRRRYMIVVNAETNKKKGGITLVDIYIDQGGAIK